jgi:hypothetical protein
VFKAASLVFAELTGCDLSLARLDGADLRRARCASAVFDGASLSAAKVGEIDFGGAVPAGLLGQHCDLSAAGDGSRVGALGQLAAAAASGAARSGRYVGPGDVLEHAELSFGPGAEVKIDGRLVDCKISMPEDATLVIGPSGSLVRCQVIGGRIHIAGTFIEPDRTGLQRPQELVVQGCGAVSTTVEQPAAGTAFGFSSGCRLRLQIKPPNTNGEQHVDRA